MKTKGSSLHSQQPATCPYPEPNRSSPCPPTHFSNSHFNVTLPSMPGSSKWFLPSRLPTKTPYAPLLSSTCATCPTISVSFTCIAGIIFGEEYKVQNTPCHCPVTSSLSGPNTLLSILFSKPLGLCSSLNVREHV